MKAYNKFKSNDLLFVKSRLILNQKVPKNFSSPSGDHYNWIWLPFSDVKQVIKIRNAEHVKKNMCNTALITRKMHLRFLKKYNSLQRIDFILQHKASGEYIGAMNISLTNYGFEIGKYIGNKKFLGKGLSYLMSISFINYIKKNIKQINKITAITKLANYKNINLNFKLGFKIIKLVKKKYWLMELQ